jgi:phosphatidylserine/phosphatidylglycerophosphate/cardiolipin synthase-like enzyme
MGERIAGAGRGGACGRVGPRAVPLEIFVQPEVGEAPILAVIEEARRSIHVMVFQLGPGGVLDALARKARAGVEVRAILDATPLSHNHLELFAGSGIVERSGSPRFEFTHAKFTVVDGVAAIISTGNYTADQIRVDRNYLALDRDPEDVAALESIFAADWRRSASDLACARLVVSPDNARRRILRFIEGARDRLDVQSMEMADAEVRAALVARRAAGVEVRVVLADPWWVAHNSDAAAFLMSRGVEARYLVAPSVHAKAMIADGAVAFLGSENMSFTSLSRNREVGVIVEEPEGVALMARTFAGDWAAATPFVGGEPRVHAGARRHRAARRVSARRPRG